MHKLRITVKTGDSCPLFRRGKKTLDNTVDLRVYTAMYASSSLFSNDEKVVASELPNEESIIVIETAVNLKASNYRKLLVTMK